jgi:hypothetical protein
MANITNEENYDELIDIISQAPNREWVNKYLNWMKKPLESKGISSSNNKSFRTTFSSSPYAGIKLIGSTAICIKLMTADESVMVLMPRKFEELEKENIPFDNRSFDRRKEGLPDGRWYWFNAPMNGFVLDEFEDAWLEATDIELSGTSDKNIESHEQVAYRAITDKKCRETALEDAF